MGLWCKECGEFIGHLIINFNQSNEEVERQWKKYHELIENHNKLCKIKEEE